MTCSARDTAAGADLPEIMKRMRAEHAQGARNQTGFYRDTAATAKAWEETWIDFTYDLRALVTRYEARLRAAGAIDDGAGTGGEVLAVTARG